MRITVFFYSLFFFYTSQHLANSQIYDLKCERLTEPISIDVPQPRFSWKIKDDRFGATQSAYRIRVYDRLGNETWNSGITFSNTRLTRYNGQPLDSFSDYTFEIESWDESGSPYPISQSTFQTSIIEGQSWDAEWINDGQDIEHRPAYYFRKTFIATKEVEKARLHVAVAGYAHIEINGKELGQKFLNPSYTAYDKRVLFDTYDLQELEPGNNTIGLIIGNGWYNHQVETTWDFDDAPWRGRPGFIGMIEIDYADGSTEFVPTDNSWLIHESHIRFNSIYYGENTDRTMEIEDWSTNEVTTESWTNATTMIPPKGKIVGHRMEPAVRSDTLRPVEVKRINDRVYQFKFERNMAGITEFRGSFDQSYKLELSHGEVIKPDGRLNTNRFDKDHTSDNRDEQFQKDYYRTKVGTNSISPKFNYKGFQYVEIASDKAINLSEENLVAYQTHNDLNILGSFESGHPKLNKLWSICNNSYLSNTMGIPTDCPHREKNGWTGDAHIISESGLFNYDATLFYEKWLRDHQDAQTPSGNLPSIIPTSGFGYNYYALDWTSSVVLVPWDVYLMSGDKTILEENYIAMKRMVLFYVRNSTNFLLSGGFGDWAPAKTQSKTDFTASAYFYKSVVTLSKIAQVLKEYEDSNRLIGLSETIKNRINDEYLNEEQNIYFEGTQTELAIALDFGIVPEHKIEAVGQSLVKNIEDNEGLLDVGVLGNKSLLNALITIDRAEIAFNLVKENRNPSYLSWVNQGLTTLPEGWIFYPNFPYSANHAFLGTINGWLYKNLGGITPDEQHPGFENIELKPQYDYELGNISVTHDSPYGIIEISTTAIDQDNFIYEALLPPGSRANFYAPTGFKIMDYQVENSSEIPQANQISGLQLKSGKHYLVLSKELDEAFVFEPIEELPSSQYGQFEIQNSALTYLQGTTKLSQIRWHIFDNQGLLNEKLTLRDFNEDRIYIKDLEGFRAKNLQISFELVFEDGIKKSEIKRLRLIDEPQP